MSIRLRRPARLSAISVEAVQRAGRAGDRHPAERLGEQAADRLDVVVVGQLDVEQLAEVLDRQPGGHPDACPSSSRSTGGALDVVLVGDLADDLLEDVLDGDQAGGAAVLVDHDGDVGAARPASRAAARRPAWTPARRSAGRITSSTVGRRGPLGVLGAARPGP